jgi:hypothetical protein
VCERYLRHIEGRRSASTFEIRQRYLSGFCKEGFKDRLVGSLTHFDVYAYCDLKRQRRAKKLANWGGKEELQWTDGTVRIFMMTLSAALNWGVKTGVMANYPPDAGSPARPASVSCEFGKP